MSFKRRITAYCLSLTLLAGCGGGASSSGTSAPITIAAPATSTPSPGATPTPAASLNTKTATVYACPTASTSGGALDCTTLPIGDQKYTTTAAKSGYVFLCGRPNGVSSSTTNGPWINSGNVTWNLTKKIAVMGSVVQAGSFAAALSVDGTSRALTGNALPLSPYVTGTFPIAASDPAYVYDHNPNSITAHTLSYALPVNPTQTGTPACLPAGGIIGITVSGVEIFNAFDATGNDAVVREMQDTCFGHPDQSSTYHVHGMLQMCTTDGGSKTVTSSLLGYALDGFGIYGPWQNGKILTSADLDACHGITSTVTWNGVLTSKYHYVSTYDFPYTLGCYSGTPVHQ